jgi:hypothetical protein
MIRLGFVISMNERRRHMSEAELAFIGEELAKLAYGGDRRSHKFQGSRDYFENQKKVAEQLGVNEKTISNVPHSEADGRAEYHRVRQAVAVRLSVGRRRQG